MALKFQSLNGFTFSILLFSVNFGISLSVAQIPDEALQKTSELVVKIDGMLTGAPTVGGGIIFGREKDTFYIATANHVVRRGEEEVQNLQVTFKSNPSESLPGILLRDFDSILDLAVVRVDGLEKKNIDVCNFSLNRLGKLKDLKRGSSVFAVGHPNGVSWFLPSTSDPVAQLVGDFINFESFRVGKGHSGGALLNEKGGVVGMISADQPPFGRAIKLEAIIESLESRKFPIGLKDLNSSPLELMNPAAKENDVGVFTEIFDADYCVASYLNTRRYLCVHPCGEGGSWEHPLSVATKNNSIEIVQLLLKKGVDSNGSALHVAVQNGVSEITKILINAGADVMALDENRNTPLHIAAHVGSTDISLNLIEAEADVMSLNKNGDTPLHVAAKNHNGAVAILLLREGASPKTLNKDGLSAKDIVRETVNYHDPEWAHLKILMEKSGSQ